MPELLPVLEPNLDGLDEEGQAAVRNLSDALAGLQEAIVGLRAAGVKPVDGLRACGVEIPAFAAPMVNSILP